MIAFFPLPVTNTVFGLLLKERIRKAVEYYDSDVQQGCKEVYPTMQQNEADNIQYTHQVAKLLVSLLP